MAEHHDKKGEPPTGLADWDRARAAPVHLSSLSGLEGQGEVGSVAHRAHHTDILFEDTEAALVTLGADLLQDLCRTVRMTLQKPPDHRLEGIQFAGSPGRTAGNELVGARIFGHCFRIEPQGVADLPEVEPLVLVKVPDPAACLVVDHLRSPAFICRRNSLMLGPSDSPGRPATASATSSVPAARRNIARAAGSSRSSLSIL